MSDETTYPVVKGFMPWPAALAIARDMGFGLNDVPVHIFSGRMMGSVSQLIALQQIAMHAADKRRKRSASVRVRQTTVAASAPKSGPERLRALTDEIIRDAGRQRLREVVGRVLSERRRTATPRPKPRREQTQPTMSDDAAAIVAACY